MSCTLCIKHKKSNALTGDCRNFKTSTLTRHADSKDHKEAVAAESMAGSFEKTVKKVLDEKEAAVVSALKVVFWMTKEDISIIKYESLLNLLEELDCPSIVSLKTGKKVTYSSDKAATEILESLAYVARQKVNNMINKSPYISLLCDESTDIGVHKKLAVYTRIVDPETFEPSTHFVCNVQVDRGTGKAIYSELKNLMTEKNIPCEKVMGLGTDGARVMTGMGEGLTGYMARDNPMIVNYHCIAHKLALVTSQAADAVPYLVDYQSVLTGIFYFFKASANRTQRLSEIQILLDEPVLKVKEVHQVRWMSVFLAVETVYKTLDSLITLFTDDKDAKAKGYGKKMIQHDFIATTYLLMDVLPVVTELCLVFQKADLDVSLVKVSVDHCKKVLNDIKSGDNQGHLHKLQNEDFTVERGKVVFKGNHIVQGKQNIDSIKVKFIDAVLDRLSQRFPEDDSNIMYAFAALSMRPISFCSVKERENWGNDKIEILIKQYGESKTSKGTESQPEVCKGAIIDPEATRNEWTHVKNLVVQEGYPRDKMSSLWGLICKNYKQQFPNLVHLAALAVTAPIHTSDCERGFSAQNQVKTALRNRISSERVDDLLIVKIEGEDLKNFDFLAALQHWRTNKQRKLFLSSESK